MRKLIVAATAAIAMLVAAAPAQASVTLIVNGSGQLTGANGVTVDGSTYNVRFVEGTCTAVFDGCDSNSDFTFNTAAAAIDASQALLDQVFLDTKQGLFDSDYSLTFGCSTNGTGGCDALVPFEWTGTYWVGRGAENRNTTDYVTFSGALPGIDTTDLVNPFGGPSAVFATFTAVPEPSTWAMMLFGFGGIGLAMRGRKRANLTLRRA